MEDDGDVSKHSKILTAIFKKRKFRRQIWIVRAWEEVGCRRQETMDLTVNAFI